MQRRFVDLREVLLGSDDNALAEMAPEVRLGEAPNSNLFQWPSDCKSQLGLLT